MAQRLKCTAISGLGFLNPHMKNVFVKNSHYENSLQASNIFTCSYKSKKLDIGYRIDVLVNDKVVVELKTVESILPIHEAQTLTYMRLGGRQVSLILNFDVTILKNGIKRLVYKLKE